MDGEVWIDERGEAVVVLPDHVHGRELAYEPELQSADSAEAGAELANGRLTITSATPHAKVAWRLTCRTTAEPACEEGASR